MSLSFSLWPTLIVRSSGFAELAAVRSAEPPVSAGPV